MAPPGELQVNAGVVLLAGNTVWSTPERLRGKVLMTRRYTNRCLSLALQYRLALYSILIDLLSAMQTCNLKVLYKSAAAGDWICRTLVLVGRWTDPNVAVVTEYNSRTTRQVVKVRLASFYQRTWNIDQNTLTQLHTTLTYM